MLFYRLPDPFFFGFIVKSEVPKLNVNKQTIQQNRRLNHRTRFWFLHEFFALKKKRIKRPQLTRLFGQVPFIKAILWFWLDLIWARCSADLLRKKMYYNAFIVKILMLWKSDHNFVCIAKLPIMFIVYMPENEQALI